MEAESGRNPGSVEELESPFEANPEPFLDQFRLKSRLRQGSDPASMVCSDKGEQRLAQTVSCGDGQRPVRRLILAHKR